MNYRRATQWIVNKKISDLSYQLDQQLKEKTKICDDSKSIDSAFEVEKLREEVETLRERSLGAENKLQTCKEAMNLINNLKHTVVETEKSLSILRDEHIHTDRAGTMSPSASTSKTECEEGNYFSKVCKELQEYIDRCETTKLAAEVTIREKKKSLVEYEAAKMNSKAKKASAELRAVASKYEVCHIMSSTSLYWLP